MRENIPSYTCLWAVSWWCGSCWGHDVDTAAITPVTDDAAAALENPNDSGILSVPDLNPFGMPHNMGGTSAAALEDLNNYGLLVLRQSVLMECR